MSKPFVAIVMGSDSDLPVMEACFDVLRSFDVPFEARITSAHRTPEVTKAYVKEAEERGCAVFIAAAGMGFGQLAFSCMSGELEAASSRAGDDLQPRVKHFEAPAKSVIMLMQNGGPGQMDLFDPKPELTKFSGKIHTEKVEMFRIGG